MTYSMTKMKRWGGQWVCNLREVGQGKSLRGAHEKEPGMRTSGEEPLLWAQATVSAKSPAILEELKEVSAAQRVRERRVMKSER